MAKKIEDKVSTASVGHYYVKDHFVTLAQPMYLQKKQTQKAIDSQFTEQVFYTESFAEVYDPEDRHFIDERLSWYDAIENGDLKPSIDQHGNVSFLADRFFNSQHTEWCEQIEKIASQWIEREYCSNTQVSYSSNIDAILQALSQLTRYLPELQEKQPNYFLDVETYKIGVTMQGEGTLTLLIGGNSEVEYSYAQRQAKGSIRVSGIAKLTTNIRNSKNIWKLLNLQGIIK
ncbi:hypothetical protein [Pseudomonas mercuritolerans]|uniref:Uncharacterized protein n=1 Tax=Pseudomonas mercuritolerans TaxID=2951809 RepID=A0ABT2XPD4_9PSED|nr:hypothetical protein [Pseudomonas mercuritolerans]MCV2220562.1 hypothetical protein [Pseudomonas mercuritolerans]